jgi:hypothetical protein
MDLNLDNIKTVAGRPTIERMIKDGESMLRQGGLLPAAYSAIETEADALAAAMTKPRTPTLRVHIVWDNEADGNFELEEVLQRMRETGAAMVTKVEEVS